MNARPSVTAIIATHNRARLLAEALDSVYAQEGLGKQFDVEVVVVDDASTDNTGQVVARYPEARCIRFSINRGPSAVRNAGIASSSGKYVAFLDDDDLWLPPKLSRQVAALEAHPEAGVAYSQFVIASGAHSSVFPGRSAPSGSVFERFLFVNLCGIPASPLVRREALTKVGAFDEGIGNAEDYDLWLRLAFHVPFVFVPGTVAVYRRTDEGKMGNSVRSGRYETFLPLVLERALALLPDTADTSRLKRQVRANCELRLADLLTGDAAWERLRAGLMMSPELVFNPGNDLLIAHTIADRAAHLDSPIAAATQMWREIDALQRDLGPREQAAMRRLLATVYWHVGVVHGKGIGQPVDARTAARSVVRSLMLEPVAVRRWGILLRFLFRRAFGLHTH